MDAHTHEITEVPEVARVITMALSMITISVLAICLTRRIQIIKNWRNISLTNALIVAIYIDSFLFIFCTAILSKAYSLNQSTGICDGAILLCLLCYMTTKIMIYYFLVEKVHIIRTTNLSRMKSKLWLFNFFGVICPYVVLVILNFVFRIAYINEKGVCVIGMKRRALVPLITFDVVLNVYLTSLFLHPLRLLFTVCVLHWATAIDKDRSTTSESQKPKHTSESRGGLNSTTDGKADDYLELDERYVAKLTTVIEANKESPDLSIMDSHAIGIKTQHVREVETENYDIDCEGGTWRESQERIVKPGSI
ncbi:hypothetical protein QM012_000506 [Aureobasidium pullulans]|uniref:G-protein coupled receptors family 1 profile domain-containing protein n=1 Tax=Aureobasidium pullulans TaxID=5580 RepID=A0ABR0TW16_AURPU